MPQPTPAPPHPVAPIDVARDLGLERRHWSRRLIGWAAVLALIAGAAVGGVKLYQRRAAAAKPTYVTAPITRGDLQVEVTATGTIEALTKVEVGAEVSGRVTRVAADYNDRVTVGQVLAEIDPEQLGAESAQASARVSAAEAQIRMAEATLEEATTVAARAEVEFTKGLIAQRDLDTARAAKSRAQAALDSARAEARLSRASLTSAASRLGKTKILSPIDGVVLSRLVEPGQTVTAGFQTPVLFKLAEDLTRMTLNVFVDEADVGRVREGQKASFTVEAYPDRTFSSEVRSIRNEPTKDQNVVTYEAVLAAANEQQLLRPGMTATATIVTETRRNVLLSPNAALRFAPPGQSRGGPPGSESAQGLNDGAGPRVWVLRDGAPVAIPVTPGATDGRFTEIVKGELVPGTAVLTDVVTP